jgi:glycosyltransferase involved in cell wall biosynthesis
MNQECINLHINLNRFTNASRVLKETSSLVNAKLVEKILIVALHEDKLQEFETIDARRSLWRVKLKSCSWSKSLWIQILKYLEFGWRVSMFAKANQVNMVNVHSVDLLPLGVWLKLKLGAKLIYDAHELETETTGAKGIREALSQLSEKLLIPYVDLTILVGGKIKEFYQAKYELEPIVTVLNCPQFRQSYKTTLLRDKLSIPQHQKILLYQGGLSRGRGIEFLLEVGQTLSNQDYAIVFMGYGELEEKVKTIASQYSHICFYPAVPPNEVLEYTASADVGLLFYEDTCLNNRYCLPNKLFEYIMAQIPVMVSNLPEMREVVSSRQVGVVMEDWSREGFLNALGKLESMNGECLTNHLSKTSREFCWEEQEKVMLAAYRQYILLEGGA